MKIDWKWTQWKFPEWWKCPISWLVLPRYQLKMMHNWKIRNYVLFGDITEDYTAREPASHIVLRNRFKDVREEPEYIGIFPGKNRNKCVVKQQKITVNATHTHTKVVFELTSQVNDFSAFLCMERYKQLDSLKLILRYTSNPLRGLLVPSTENSVLIFIFSAWSIECNVGQRLKGLIFM